MADFKVQRGYTDVDNNGTTVAPSTNFSSTASTFVLCANNRAMNSGWNASAGNMEVDDLSGGVGLASVSSIDIFRESTAAATTARVYWEALEYIGTSGGANEFIVRGRYTLILTGESTTQSVSGIANIDDCIPFITAIAVDNGGSTDDADSGTAIAWMSSTGTLNVKRGSGSNNTVQVHVVVVEFTGSDWQVAHGRLESNADSGTITLRDAADGTTVGGGDISDWETAAIFHQFKANALNGTDDSISDTSATYYPGANTSTVSFSFDVNHVDSAGAGSRNEHFVHVLKGNIFVTRYNDTQSLQGNMSVNISSAGITSMDTTLIMCSRQSSGTGTAYGRGWVGWNLTSTTNLNLWAHRSGNTISTRVQIIDFNPPQLGITDLDDEQLYINETGNTITGFGFGATQGTGKVELGDNAVYTSATLVSQTITSWSDTSIQFDVVQGTLLEGTVWVYVTNDSGDVSGGYKVNLGTPAYSTSVKQLSPDHYWMFQNSYDDEINSNSFNNVVSGSPTFTTLALCRGDTHSIQLDGTTANEHIECADSDYMNTNIKRTRRYMGGWIQLDSVQKILSVIYEEGAQVNNIAFLVGFGNILMLQVADTGDDYVQAYSDFTLTPNRTYHIFFKFEASAQDAEVRLYIDGILQNRTNGNPWTATDLDTHSGNISMGHQTGENLEVGGTDIAFATPIKCNYAHWATWSDVVVSPTDIKEKLVEQGMRSATTIQTDTAANMQTSFSAYDNTTRTDTVCSFYIAEPSDSTNLTIIATNMVFEDRISYHINWGGSGILTIVNSGTSNIVSTKCATTGGGSIVIQQAVPIAISVKDISDTSDVVGAMVYILADTGGDLATGTEILKSYTDSNGIAQTTIVYTNDQPITGYVRKGTSAVYYKQANISGTITSAGYTEEKLVIRDE